VSCAAPAELRRPVLTVGLTWPNIRKSRLDRHLVLER
jgi:hypothetical protein